MITGQCIIVYMYCIYPSSGACDYSVELPHWLYCSAKTEDLGLHTTIYANAKSSVFTEKYDQRGNSTEQSQAPDDGYINVRNMLST